MQKNVAGQLWVVFAFDRTDNTPVTGDAAQITANLRLDGGAANAVDDTNPAELEDGFYFFTITQAECNADMVLMSPESSTGDVQVIGVPGVIYTTAPAANTLTAATVNTAVEGGQVGTDATAILADTGTTLPATLALIPQSGGTTSWNATALGAVNAECDTAFASWAPPTKAEMDTAHGLLATEAKQDIIDTEVDKIPKSDSTVTWNATALASINTQVDAAIETYKLDKLVSAADADDPVDGSIMAHLVSATEDWSTFVPSDDSLQAIRDRGDAAWAAGSGLTPLASGTAQSGTSSTIVLTSGATFADDELNGNIIKVTAGTGAGQARLIISNTLSDDTCNVKPNWTTNPASDSVYEIVEGSVNIEAISLDNTAANNLELDYDGTGYAKANSTIGTATVNTDLATFTSGMTSLPEWLGAMAGDQASDATAQTEMRATGAGSGTYDATTDSSEALRNRGDAAWVTGAGGAPPTTLQTTTITGLSSQTVFNLTAGSADNGAYVGAMAVIEDASTATQKAVGLVKSYTSASKTITLDEDPGVFTMANGDAIDIIATSRALPEFRPDAAGGLPVSDAGGLDMDSMSTVLNLFQFTATNNVQADIQYVNSVALTGAGVLGDEWNP